MHTEKVNKYAEFKVVFKLASVLLMINVNINSYQKPVLYMVASWSRKEDLWGEAGFHKLLVVESGTTGTNSMWVEISSFQWDL